MESLTERQRQVLNGICQIAREIGYPPTVREIGQRLGLSSSCTVQRHLQALERKGYIRRSRLKARSIELMEGSIPAMPLRGAVPIPLVGTVTAGQPILAVENIEQVYALPSELVEPDRCFMLRVRGDSMIEAGLLDGDLVVVRQQQTAEEGDIVVAMLDDEATIKRFYRQNGKFRLQPANRGMQPIITDQVQILGKVVLSLRQYS